MQGKRFVCGGGIGGRKRRQGDHRLGSSGPKGICLNSLGTGELLKVQRRERYSQSLAAKEGQPWRQGGL